MPIIVVGDAGLDSIAQGRTTAVSGDTVATGPTTFLDVPNLYNNEQIVSNVSKTLIYTFTNDVIVNPGTVVTLISLTGSDTVTVLGLRGAPGINYAIWVNGYTGTAIIKSLLAICANRGIYFQTIGASSNITIEGSGVRSIGSQVMRILTASAANFTVVVQKCMLFGWNGVALSPASFGASSTFDLKDCFVDAQSGSDLTNGGAATVSNCHSPDGTAGNTTSVSAAKINDPFAGNSKNGLPDFNIYDGASPLLAAGAAIASTDINGLAATSSDVGCSFRTEAVAPGAPDNPRFSNPSGDQHLVTVDSIGSDEKMVVEGTVAAATNWLYRRDDGLDIFTTDSDDTRFEKNKNKERSFEKAGISAIKVSLRDAYNQASASAAATEIEFTTTTITNHSPGIAQAPATPFARSV